MKAPKSTPNPKRPVVLINLQGGVVHSVHASEELHDVLFVFSGDAEDCRSENKSVTNYNGDAKFMVNMQLSHDGILFDPPRPFIKAS